MAPVAEGGNRLAGVFMAAALVNRLCAPTALALKQAGMEYLLVDAAQAQAFRNGVREVTRQPESAGMRERVVKGLAEKKGDTESAVMRERASQDAPETQATQRKKPPQAAPNLADWPAGWRERLQQTRPAPVIWTYWELGQDLCGAPDPNRRELLGKLLKDLAHPPGTHSFWPLALPRQDGDGEQELEANAPVFWEGVRLLRGRAVVLMGSTMLLRALALPEPMHKMRPFQQVRHEGRLLIVLSPPGMLVQETRRIQALREFLRQTLAPFT